MILDYFSLALKNLKKRKVRSWLTMVGIVISIATIFLLISVSLGLRFAIEEQFRILGTDKFFILPKGQLGAPGTGGAVQLTVDDVNVVEKVQGVKDVSYVTVANGEVINDAQKRYFMIAGLPLEKSQVFQEISAFKPDEGRLLKDSDRGKIMIGSEYKYNKVFRTPIHVGDKLTINGIDFKVIGILAPIGNPQDDKNIIMSLDDLKEIAPVGNRVDEILVQTVPGQNVEAVSDAVKRKLMSFRNVKEKTIDFTISTPEELLSSFDTILNILTAFLVGVAAISLLVGAIGIANTMYTSVLERTREIGVMKAIGAQNRDVLLIFLIEAGLLGLVGGIVGVALGIAAGKLIEYIAITQLATTLLKAATPIYLIIGCLAFAFLIGTASGLWPAWRATKIKPVEALRYE